MKKLILLFALLLPVSAFSDPVRKLHDLYKEVLNQGSVLAEMEDALPEGSDRTVAQQGSNTCMLIMTSLNHLTLHRATVQSGVGNTGNYILAHTFVEKDLEGHIRRLSKCIARASKASLAGELRDCRKLHQKCLRVLRETRL